MQVTETGSVRVDLVGGTLDLEPINLIIPNVVTLNVATSLKAEVTLEKTEAQNIVIESLDYKKTYQFDSTQITDEDLYFKNTFEEMTFVLQILDLFNVRSGMKVELKSGAPAGSGLGGSSAMGITLYKALCKFFDKEFEVASAVQQVKSIEGRILNRGMPGYQDYFPAAVGGVLCLKGESLGINVEQLYSSELKEFLEKHVTLVYSGISRNSGINNWDVYKGFFDQEPEIQKSLREIAEVSYKTYLAIKDKDYKSVLNFIGKEGELRKSLALNIVPGEVSVWYDGLKHEGIVEGMKMCGAGGGGCFILVHQQENREEILKRIEDSQFKKLDFEILGPLN